MQLNLSIGHLGTVLKKQCLKQAECIEVKKP